MMRTWILPLAALLVVGVASAGPEEDVMSAVELPVQAKKARDGGLSAKEVNVALLALKESKVKASDASRVLKAAGKSVREHGVVENFGTFVGKQLKDGLRGKKLSAAITAELEAHGKIKGKGHGKDKGKSEGGHGKDKADGDKSEGGHGKDKADGDKGKSEGGHGKADGDKGKSEGGHGKDKADGDKGESEGGHGKADGDKAGEGKGKGKGKGNGKGNGGGKKADAEEGGAE
jgi:hypothetical protein